jgi:hypothetical protein
MRPNESEPSPMDNLERQKLNFLEEFKKELFLSMHLLIASTSTSIILQNSLGKNFSEALVFSTFNHNYAIDRLTVPDNYNKLKSKKKSIYV